MSLLPIPRKPTGIMDAIGFGQSSGVLGPADPGMSMPAPPAVAPVSMGAPAQPTSTPTLEPVETNIQAPREGILDRIGGFLGSDDGKAALLRSGAATLQGGLGAGILAGANYIDQQKAQRREDARDQREFGLKERGVANTEKATTADIDQGYKRIGQQDRAIDNDYDLGVLGQDTARRGQDLNFKSNQMSNDTTRRGQDLNLTSDREQRTLTSSEGDKNRQVQRENNLLDYGASTATARRGKQYEMKDALSIMEQLAPGFAAQSGGSAEDWSKAVQADPNLFSGVIDATLSGLNNGGINAARAGIDGVLSRYTYSNPWIGGPRFTRNPDAGGSTAAATQGATGEIRYGPDGKAYRRGPNGEAIPVN